MKKAERKGSPFHELKILHLGMEAKVKAHDMTAAAYLRNISMRCFHFPGKCAGPSVKDNAALKTNIGTGLIFCILLCAVSIPYIYSVLVML
jgi:hypothetical protein